MTKIQRIDDEMDFVVKHSAETWKMIEGWIFFRLPVLSPFVDNLPILGSGVWCKRSSSSDLSVLRGVLLDIPRDTVPRVEDGGGSWVVDRDTKE